MRQDEALFSAQAQALHARCFRAYINAHQRLKSLLGNIQIWLIQPFCIKGNKGF